MKLRWLVITFVQTGLATLLFAQQPPDAPPLPSPPPPQSLPRTSNSIAVDGDLGDPGWSGALQISTFYETIPGDNTVPKVATTAWVTYDANYFYIGLKCDDPDPAKIRAPFVDRDQVFGTDDNVAVFLDTRNDKRSAIELRVNPRGIQGDAVFNDANGSEDFSPDFFYDTAARITSEGWTAEMRVPFSSLRYPETDPQTWGILVWRNYPRDFRYFIHSAPIPRGSNCLVCHTHALTNITGLPASGHLVVAPYVTAAQNAHPEGEPGTSFENDPLRSDVGMDVKWNPNADTTIDGTINPDFSQVEADVAQIAVNERFALFFPEKRPFFLEGVDLFDTPMQAVYTRTITSPRWGARGTGKMGSTAYTMLVSEDRGGGLLILPGPLGNDFAAQDFRALVGIGRLRRDFGRSFGGLLLTHRELEDGGHNSVIGPDFQWRPNQSDSVTGQVLYSNTENPDAPDENPAFDGQSLSSHAASLAWGHNTQKLDWFLRARDIGEDFRADLGFIPQVGYREGVGELGLRFYPKGLFSFVRTYMAAVYTYDQDNQKIGQSLIPGIFVQGRKNLAANFEIHPADETFVGDRLLTERNARFFVQFDPSRRFPRIGINARFGDAIDFANGRVGDGTTVGLAATIRPHDRLSLELNANRQWLDVDATNASGRLFTAQVERLKATYAFTANSLLRIIGQYVETERDPSLYDFEVPSKSGSFLGSLLYSYKINWQTVLFVGYGDNQILNENSDLLGTDRSLFLKISYALQR